METKKMMTTLVVGASCATGRLLVEQLLGRGQQVKVVVRSMDSLPENVMNHKNLSAIHASTLDLSDSEIATCKRLRCCGIMFRSCGVCGGSRLWEAV